MKKALFLLILLSFVNMNYAGYADGILPAKQSQTTLSTVITTTEPAVTIKAENKDLIVPSFTSIPLIFKYSLSGNAVKNGDPISVQVNDDVFVNNTLIFKKGQDAILFVDKSKHAGAFGRGGKLDIQSGSIRDSFGNTYTMNVTKHIGADSKPSALILPIVSLVVCWPLAFLAFRHGEDAIIPPGTLVNGLTTSPQTVSIK